MKEKLPNLNKISENIWWAAKFFVILQPEFNYQSVK